MNKINVTRSFLPPLEEYLSYLRQIWKSDQLTNQGPLLKEFEKQTEQYLGADNFHFVSNGTLALQIALRALDITGGEVITTPFSYVATTSAILWEHCTPVFVDIDPDTLNIDPAKIEAAITSKTRAIMPVHVFGNPCDVEAIEAIAKKHDLKVIYDAAHAFGAKYRGKSLLDYGDVSTGSFHATKLFHTIEGGCIIAKDKSVSDRVELIKRFGHNGDEHIMLGMNAKASEFQAAMGLCNLKYIDEIIEARKYLTDRYDQILKGEIQRPVISPDTERNYIYYPIILESETKLIQKIRELNKHNIFPRRYFYPSLDELPYAANKQSCYISEDIAKRIMCLPLYHGLEDKTVAKICKVLAA